jgi:hypothetical protein
MIKTILSAFFLFIAAIFGAPNSALACPEGQSEMQFIAQAQITRTLGDGSCEYTLRFSYSAPNVNCQLNESDLKNVVFNSADCSVTREKEVSGVLIRKGNQFLFD